MTKIKAKNKIINHIKKYGKNNKFKITNRIIKYWWKLINIAIFDNKLHSTEFKIKNIASDTYAECEGFIYEDNEEIKILITINSSNILNREHFITVLIHEMVHSYQYLYLKNISHGKSFFDWKECIEETLGLKLQMKINENDVLI